MFSRSSEVAEPVFDAQVRAQVQPREAFISFDLKVLGSVVRGS
jgi:hypothetical protein